MDAAPTAPLLSLLLLNLTLPHPIALPQVGAMVILPIVQKVGEDMPSPHPKLLVMATALMCSGESRA